MYKNYKSLLRQSVKRHRINDWQDNWDYRRFGPYQSPCLIVRAKMSVKSTVKALLESVGLYRNKVLASMLANEVEFQWLFERLSDEESRRVLIDVLTYRVLGHRKVKLPLNTPTYWKKLEELEERQQAMDVIDLGILGWKLNRIDMQPDGYPIQMYSRPSGAYTQLILQQYRCETADGAIEVAAGDTVIDAGGCYGDTALYFAAKAGPSGQVFSFEFMPDNVKIFDRNLALNPELASRIHLQEHPLWSCSGESLFVEGIGPAAHVTPVTKDPSAKQTETLSIDDLAEREGGIKVDFIKMDIEGAELEALKGAEKTIRRCCPKLAISVYHHLCDFWEIPQWIDGLGLGYRFYLRHFTVHAEETVLFAEVL